ncbi:cupin domain-containing protein [Dyella choica]|uniref:Cupin domain-containing protein n=1 Tax=Dyella choica TaxID=1927959 RepID=A0A432M0F5_9GAMM|nr:cupin domain-containing protein [Dyella choica]RUL70179.1 cupin domain-containing protein [Dyella choica]
MRYMAAIVLCMALGASGNSLAAEEHALLSSPLTDVRNHQLQAVTVTYAPGQSSAPHRHGGDAFVYVLSGHIRSQVGSDAVRTYGPGDSWFEPMGAHHVVSGNASTIEPATMLVVFVAAPGAMLTVWDSANAPSQPMARPPSR